MRSTIKSNKLELVAKLLNCSLVSFSFMESEITGL